jgi:hypothetical protein
VAFQLPPAHPEQGDLVQQTARAVKEFGEVLAELAGAMADGTITEAERRSVALQIADVHQSLAALQALVARKVAA